MKFIPFLCGFLFSKSLWIYQVYTKVMTVFFVATDLKLAAVIFVYA